MKIVDYLIVLSGVLAYHRLLDDSPDLQSLFCWVFWIMIGTYFLNFLVKAIGKQMSVRTDIKNCPFCGGEASLVQCTVAGVYTKEIFIECNDCKGRGKPYFGGLEGKEKVVEAWNRRVGDDS